MPSKNKNSLNKSGLLLFVAGVLIFMSIITAEALYPADYSTALNDISDLGSTSQSKIVIYQPSANIFNFSMMLAGSMVIAAAYFLRRKIKYKLFVVLLGLYGVGVLGVGFVPASLPPHAFFAGLTFISGGIAAVMSARIVEGYFRYSAAVLGIIALASLIFMDYFAGVLGYGGIERWIAYPITLWHVGLGGYLMGKSE